MPSARNYQEAMKQAKTNAEFFQRTYYVFCWISRWYYESERPKHAEGTVHEVQPK